MEGSRFSNAHDLTVGFKHFQDWCTPSHSRNAAGLKPGSHQKAVLDAALKRRSTMAARGYSYSGTSLDQEGGVSLALQTLARGTPRKTYSVVKEQSGRGQETPIPFPHEALMTQPTARG